jgi:L-lactate dehydrogenase complex protein LldG
MSERGDRARFLAAMRQRAGRRVVAGAHPRPAPRSDAPLVGFHVLDGIDPSDPGSLLSCFATTARAASVTVWATPAPAVAPAALAAMVARHGVHRAVLSAEDEAQACRADLEALGVTVTDHTGAGPAAEADLGVTSAVAGVAATGSLVVSSRQARGRAASLLPRVHLCLLPVDRLVATPADVLRGGRSHPPPSNLVFITGPSRTGDIEQVMTLGVHGPTAVHVVVTGAPFSIDDDGSA